MAQLHELALQFQQALYGSGGPVPRAAVDALGWELSEAMHAAIEPAQGSADQVILDFRALEAVIRRTKLAAAITAHFKRISWAEVTPQMLCEPAGTPLAAVGACADLLGLQIQCALHAAATSGAQSTVPSLLLLQVKIPCTYPSVKPTHGCAVMPNIENLALLPFSAALLKVTRGAAAADVCQLQYARRSSIW